MKIIFLGSSNYGEKALKALIDNGYNVLLVVTQPDKKQGRGMLLDSTPIKKMAIELGIDVYQPENINSDDSVKFLKSFAADIFVVIAYGQFLSVELLSIPKIFALNVHASLLPKYRGAAPINFAVIKGDKTTGNTLMKMSEKMDAGPILFQSSLEILKVENAEELESRMADDAAQLLIKGLEKIKSNEFELLEQDKSKVTYASKLKKEIGLINWQMSALEIDNLVRGCIPWPGAFTYFNGKILKILKSFVVESDKNNTVTGEVLEFDKEGIVVATGKGFLKLVTVQLEGKSKHSAYEFVCGQRIQAGFKFNNFSQDSEQK